MKIACLTALSLLCAGPASAVILRGPYLQMGTTEAITICWRTSAPAVGTVRYGTSPGALTNSVTATAAAANHEIRITGLQPATRYYYSIETDEGDFAGSAGHRFTTAPLADSPEPVRFWVIGDPGTGTAEAIQVRDAYRAAAQETPANFWLTLGDNAYYTGTETEYQNKFFNIYTPMLEQLCHWSCIGNHDTAFSEGPELHPYDSIFAFPTAGECGGVASGTERYYSFDWGNIHVLSIDAMTSSRLSNGAQAAWIAADLEANTKPWVIALWHHPPYDSGTHDSDQEIEQIEMRENIVPLLESHGVDLVLCGHSHVYERTRLMNGHYDFSWTYDPLLHARNNGLPDTDAAYWKPSLAATPHEGTVYVVCGNSGQAGGIAQPYPANVVNLDGMGSLMVEVTGRTLTGKFLRPQYQPGDPLVYDDTFSITKGGEVSPRTSGAPATPGALRFLPVSNTEAIVAWADYSAIESGYRVYIQKDDSPFLQIASLPAGSLSYRLTNLSPGNPCTFKVEAWNASGSAETGSPYTLPADPTAPGALEIWRFCHLGTRLATGAAADAADFDSDGFPNIIEYAMGTLPHRSASIPTILPAVSGGRLNVSFPRMAIPELTYRVEYSSDLTASSWVPGLVSTGAANTEETVTDTDPAPAPGERRYARIRVEHP